MRIYLDRIREKIRKGEALWTPDLCADTPWADAERKRFAYTLRKMFQSKTLTAEDLKILKVRFKSARGKNAS
jgi:hypothetical protein